MGYFTGVLDYIAGRRAEQMKTRDEVLLAIQKAGSCTPAHVQAWEAAGGDLLELQSRLERMEVRQEAAAKLQRADLMQKPIDDAVKKMRAAAEKYEADQKAAQKMVDDSFRAMDEAMAVVRTLQYEQRELRESAERTLRENTDPDTLEEIERLKDQVHHLRQNPPPTQRLPLRGENGQPEPGEAQRCADDMKRQQQHFDHIASVEGEIQRLTGTILNPRSFTV